MRIVLAIAIVALGFIARPARAEACSCLGVRPVSVEASASDIVEEDRLLALTIESMQ